MVRVIEPDNLHRRHRWRLDPRGCGVSCATVLQRACLGLWSPFTRSRTCTAAGSWSTPSGERSTPTQVQGFPSPRRGRQHARHGCGTGRNYQP